LIRKDEVERVVLEQATQLRARLQEFPQQAARRIADAMMAEGIELDTEVFLPVFTAEAEKFVDSYLRTLQGEFEEART